MTWASLPPSIGAYDGIGYGPGSLSSGHPLSPSVMVVYGTSGWFASTTMYGMPIGFPFQSPEPKSALRPTPGEIAAMISPESW